ncbi:MAG: UDP-N-acetylglucosamine 1-carboxyvinyltransferase [Firmicutes bacterium]|nr:UDP-N-acetylglucosamine 1-carboxyvinyltransferase [Bacillota bacterium]
MKEFIIEGGHLLSGEIKISGAKNAALALIPAALLSNKKVKIYNVPNISDIENIKEILRHLNVKMKETKEYLEIDASKLINAPVPEEISKKLRASYYFMAALLGREKKVVMHFPGGCNIGKRPIDQTLKGFVGLGATIDMIDDCYTITADNLKGAKIYLDMPSVGATINTLIASVLAEGTTIIENAAKEPEIVNVAEMLNNMGANIKGAGTSTIEINGVKELHEAEVKVIPDRIEAGTYVLAGALVGNNLKIENIVLEHIEALINKLEEMGFEMIKTNTSITISANKEMKPANITTKGYPGFPTDLQQPIVTLLSVCKGYSIVEETIYENRFNNVEYLNKLGANITINKRKLFIEGVEKLYGTEVEATDLRAGACLLLAALIAEGTTTIKNADYILRGYESITEKLKNVGAKIELEEYNKVGI